MSTRPKLLFLQIGSLYDRYGGIEYYLDDLLGVCKDLYGAENIHTMVPKRHGKFRDEIDLAYPHTTVPFSKNPVFSKIEK